MKAIWKGDISFGLVTIPIKLFSAVDTTSSKFSFRVLCSDCKSPLSYQRHCEKCNKDISWQDTVKGLKLDDGSYFIISQEELKNLRPEKTDYIDVLEFVDLGQVDPIYFNSHYYVAPEKKGEKPYYLFLQALKKTGKAALSKFVMKDKEYVALITPYEDALLLTTLNYEYEIRSLSDISELNSPAKTTKTELDLAIQLIKQNSKKKFDISKLKDEFSEKLQKAIKQGKKSKVKKTSKPTTKRSDNNLLKSLKSSLKNTPYKRTPSSRPAAIARAKKR